MNAPTGHPAVSVVVAAYGRPRVLGHALRSVQAQSFDDWEVLVVGDAAGDETREIVDDLDDERITFLDLPVNIGEQSGPNNVGIARTSAPLVAFLNQDDLWFPDHLAIAVATLDARAADLVFSPNINVLPTGSLATGEPTVVIDGLSHRGRYDPANIDGTYPASAWLARREALEALGGWRAAQETTLEPSQDLLARAHRRGMRLWTTGVTTLITLPSGTRPGSYVDSASDEHEWFAARLSDPSLRPSLLARDPRRTTEAATREAEGRSPRAVAWRRALRLIPRAGPSPRVLHRAVREHWGAGERIESLRSLRGLEPRLPLGEDPVALRRGEVLRACTIARGDDIAMTIDGGGSRYLASGWSMPEASHTWSDGTTAELAVRAATDADAHLPVQLALDVVALVDRDSPVQRVDVFVDGHRSGSWTIDHVGEVTLVVPLGDLGRRPRIVRLDLPDARPHPDDQRVLALRLLRLRLDAVD